MQTNKDTITSVAQDTKQVFPMSREEKVKLRANRLLRLQCWLCAF